MDGVIFDSERAFKKCWKVIAAKYHIINIEMLCSECSGMNWKATKEWALKRYGGSSSGSDKSQRVFAGKIKKMKKKLKVSAAIYSRLNSKCSGGCQADTGMNRLCYVMKILQIQFL